MRAGVIEYGNKDGKEECTDAAAEGKQSTTVEGNTDTVAEDNPSNADRGGQEDGVLECRAWEDTWECTWKCKSPTPTAAGSTSRAGSRDQLLQAVT